MNLNFSHFWVVMATMHAILAIEAFADENYRFAFWIVLAMVSDLILACHFAR